MKVYIVENCRNKIFFSQKEVEDEMWTSTPYPGHSTELKVVCLDWDKSTVKSYELYIFLDREDLDVKFLWKER